MALRLLNRKMAVAVVIIGILTLVPFLQLRPYFLYALTLYFVFIVLAMSWNLAGGYLGLLNLGHAAFFGIGAYATGTVWLLGLHPYAGMVFGGLVSSLVSLAFIPTFRLRTDYFAVATLAFPQIMMISLTYLSGGAAGVRFPMPAVFNISEYYYGSMGLTIIIFFTIYALANSRFGYAARAIRDSEETASVSGINVLKYKSLGLSISAFMAGVIGGFYLYYTSYIDPVLIFNLNWTFVPVFMALIGGRGTLIGPVFGAIVYMVLSQLLTFVVTGTELNLLIFGLFIIGIAILMPQGAIPTLRRSFTFGSRPMRKGS